MRRLTFPFAILLTLGVGWLDYITGYNISFFVFYAVPIMLTIRYCNRQFATLMALVCAIVWWWADVKSGHPYITDWGQLWETGVRLAFFLFIVSGGSAMKARQEVLSEQLKSLSRQRQLEREIVHAGECERQRIGRDLHDDLCQFIAGIGCAATSLKDDLRENFSPQWETAAEIQELLRDAVIQARDIARGLAPVQVDEEGLVAALEDFAANTSRLTNIRCEVSNEHDACPISQEVSTHLFRIAQEATTNAIKHARAESIRIALGGAGDELSLTICDDGVGLPEHALRSSGMGLKTMQYRARSIGAKLTITDRESGGTLVSCVLPHVAAAPGIDIYAADRC